MKEIFNFFRDNYKLILVCCSYLIYVVFFIIVLIKNPKKTAAYLLALYEKLPYLISDAEKLGFSSGEQKKAYVLSMSLKYLQSITGWKESEVGEYWSQLISSAIEHILDCPQKKGE